MKTWKQLVLEVLPAVEVGIPVVYDLVLAALNIQTILGALVPPVEGFLDRLPASFEELTVSQKAKVRQTLQQLRDSGAARSSGKGRWAAVIKVALCKCGAKLPWGLESVGVGPLDYDCSCGRGYTWTGPLDERPLIQAMKLRQEDGGPVRRRLLLFAKFEHSGIDTSIYEEQARMYGYDMNLVQSERVASDMKGIRADVIVVMKGVNSHKLAGHGERLAKKIGARLATMRQGAGASVTGFQQILGALARSAAV